MGWTDWSLDPSLVYVSVGGILYWLGGRGQRSPDHRRTIAFVAGMATIVVALDSPIDAYADELFWVHMFQHVLLLTVAPPLILLGRPWPRMWRALPMSTRVRVGRAIAGARWTAPLRRLATPISSWIIFCGSLVAWHIPAAFNATLSSGAVHECEHAIFFFSGLLFWAHVVDPGPLRARLAWPVRVAYVTGAMVVGWVLAIVLVLVPHPLYGHYAALALRPGGISALTDQQIAGGMMWVPGSISFTIAILIAFWRWVEPEPAMPRPRVDPAAPSPRPTTS
jgi:cytochrome c oxidase assembly factor CtaG